MPNQRPEDMVELQDVFHQYHREQGRAVTTTGKGGYKTAVQKIYGVPPPPPEQHNEEIDNLNTIVQGMHTQNYDLEGLAQSNTVLTRSNLAVTVQLAHMNVAMNDIQE